MLLKLSKKFDDNTDYLSLGYQTAFNKDKNKLTFYNPNKYYNAEHITDLQEIAKLVNGLPKPIFSDITLYHNCHEKIKAINQLIEKEANFPIDLESFYLSDSFETVLNKWGNEDPRRASTKEKILRFHTSSEETTLDLSFSDSTDLPDIFQFESFQNRLIELDLSYTNFRYLPNSLGTLKKLRKLFLLECHELENLPDLSDLQALTELNIVCNNLTSVPASLGDLKSLEYLLLSGKFTSVPSLGNLKKLEYLSIFSCNHLRSLPDLSNLQALSYLLIHSCSLRRLPTSLRNLQALRQIDIFCDNLRRLPNLSNLQALTELRISCNNIRSLPNLSNLQALTDIHIASNNLTGLPREILNLPADCTIDITRCNFSQTVLENLRTATADPAYRGPRISFSIPDREYREEERTIEESLKNLCDIAGKSLMTFSNLTTLPNPEEETEEKIDQAREKKEILCTWLNRLSDVADYKSQGDLQKTFVNKILEYLKLADQDDVFREIFYSVIQEASNRCGDKMTLSVLHLGIAHKLTTIDLQDIETLADFLIKGPWTIELLEGIARKKIPSLPLFDEIEVYLGYPIKLKQELNIPIDVQEMLYFRCSALKEEDLQKAKELVLSNRANEEACIEFLINHATWKKALLVNYKKEYAAIEDKKSQASNLDNPDYEAIEKHFKNDLKKLTKDVLDGLAAGCAKKRPHLSDSVGSAKRPRLS